MTNLDLLCKLIALDLITKKIDSSRRQLIKELQSQAQDHMIAMRRFRMLSQLSAYESQIISKLWQFHTSNLDDYFLSLSTVMKEIEWVIDRSG